MVVSPPAAETLFSRFKIEFDAGPEPVFHGGELITGSLKIQLKQECTINSIRLQFRGLAVWLGPTEGKKAEKAQGKTEKIYFDKDFVLLERPPGHPEPGHFPWNANFPYSLPFECPLPKGCETSYEGPHGFIRYYARVVLETDEPSQKAQYLVKKAFSIVSPPELHQLVPPQSDPTSAKKTVRFGGCCCRTKMTAEIHLPKSAYAPGENIIGTFTVDSRTAKNAIEHIEVRLVDRLQRILEVPPATPTPLIESMAPANNETAGAAPNEANATDDKNTPAANPSSNSEAVSNGNAKKKKMKATTKAQGANNSNAKASSHGKKGTAAVAAVGQPCQCQRVISGRKLTKEDFLGRTEAEQQIKGAQMVTRTNVLFMRVPAVTPSSQVENVHPHAQHTSMLFDEYAAAADGTTADLLEENNIVNRLLESPSTATLRARKEPFLLVDYALQISIGAHVLLELPIQVHPIPVYAKGIGFGPFGAGAQPISEPDEAAMFAFSGPFMFRPLYPMHLEAPTVVIEVAEPASAEAMTASGIVDNVGQENAAVPNGVKTTTTKTTTTKTTVVVRHGDGETAAISPPVQLPAELPTYEPELLQKASGELEQQPFVLAVVEEQRQQKEAKEEKDDAQGAPTAQSDAGPAATSSSLENAAVVVQNGPAPSQPAELTNGMATAAGEEEEEGSKRVVVRQEEEQYEVQNEDGSKTTVIHKKIVEETTQMVPMGPEGQQQTEQQEGTE